MDSSSRGEHYIKLRGLKLPDHARYLWRYDVEMIYWADGHQNIYFQLTGYEIISETDKGFWILKYEWYWFQDKKIPRHHQRFVLKVSRPSPQGQWWIGPKRWAYEDKDDAWQSFKIRKNRQHGHLERQLGNAVKICKMLDDGETEHRFQIPITRDLAEY